jgi:chemotaxis protein methyltransferase CheR
VVIYFSKDLQKQLYNKFHDALNRDGYFVMGRTEMLVGDARDKFRSINSKERIYQKPRYSKTFTYPF